MSWTITFAVHHNKKLNGRTSKYRFTIANYNIFADLWRLRSGCVLVQLSVPCHLRLHSIQTYVWNLATREGSWWWSLMDAYHWRSSWHWIITTPHYVLRSYKLYIYFALISSKYLHIQFAWIREHQQDQNSKLARSSNTLPYDQYYYPSIILCDGICLRNG